MIPNELPAPSEAQVATWWDMAHREWVYSWDEQRPEIRNVAMHVACEASTNGARLTNKERRTIWMDGSHWQARHPRATRAEAQAVANALYPKGLPAVEYTLGGKRYAKFPDGRVLRYSEAEQMYEAGWFSLPADEVEALKALAADL